MPELPEVETTRRGIEPHLLGHTIAGAIVRNPRLRWPVPEDLDAKVHGQQILQVRRRAKYLIIDLESGFLLLHLGMSGNLRVVPANTPLRPHDHVDLLLDDGFVLRLHDPRRFGALLWYPAGSEPALLANIGPEPLSPAFDGAYLAARARGKQQAVKQFIMDAQVVAGVGNIYANEALYRAGVDPARAAGRISGTRYARLAQAIKTVLQEAIEAGGTTLRDFSAPSGKPGYFVLSLQVYGREGEPCAHCGNAIRQTRIGQRSTFHCPKCQT